MSEDEEPLTASQWEELPPVLTPEQVARVLGWSRLAVIRAAKKGTLPGRKVGQAWRFSKDRIAGVTGEPGSVGDPDREGDSPAP